MNVWSTLMRRAHLAVHRALARISQGWEPTSSASVHWKVYEPLHYTVVFDEHDVGSLDSVTVIAHVVPLMCKADATDVRMRMLNEQPRIDIAIGDLAVARLTAQQVDQIIDRLTRAKGDVLALATPTTDDGEPCDPN